MENKAPSLTTAPSQSAAWSPKTVAAILDQIGSVLDYLDLNPHLADDHEELYNLLTEIDIAVEEDEPVRVQPRTLLDQDMLTVSEEMIRAASESRAKDDEGEFPPLCDLLGFSGENKTRTVVRAALEAALAHGGLILPGTALPDQAHVWVLMQNTGNPDRVFTSVTEARFWEKRAQWEDGESSARVCKVPLTPRLSVPAPARAQGMTDPAWEAVRKSFHDLTQCIANVHKRPTHEGEWRGLVYQVNTLQDAIAAYRNAKESATPVSTQGVTVSEEMVERAVVAFSKAEWQYRKDGHKKAAHLAELQRKADRVGMRAALVAALAIPPASAPVEAGAVLREMIAAIEADPDADHGSASANAWNARFKIAVDRARAFLAATPQAGDTK